VTFLGATAAGVALGGPLGMLGGAALAAWFNDTMDTAATAEESREQLALAQTELQESRTDLSRTQRQLAEARETTRQYARLVLDQLELEMLFKTNATELTPAGQQRLASVAEFLVANPQIEVRLDGYADPRGDANYNQQLSLGRVHHVARALAEGGVDQARIESFSHGASQSSAPAGDYDAYALERAVKINLRPSPGATGYARVD
jgi:outer membrane protein OmpA-like peptidoglycan-associated protein